MSLFFECLTPRSVRWKELTIQIANVSWRAGASLAEKMKNETFSHGETVIVGTNDEGEMACFCRVSQEDGLIETSFGPFIGYVFVKENYRGRGLSAVLLKEAESFLKGQQVPAVYIVSGEVGLYEKSGYEKIKDCETIHGHIESLFWKKL